jgi:hypothetical protein
VSKKQSSISPGDIGMGAGLLPFFPGSTGSRLAEGQGARGAGAGIVTDVSRGLGGVAGSSLAANAMTHGPMPQSAAARLAIMLAGGGIGAAAGHIAGKSVGSAAFRPDQTLVDKLRHALRR